MKKNMKKKNYIGWYIDPSYSNAHTIWRDGFAMCVVNDDEGKWSVQAYDERNGSFSTGRIMFELSPFKSAEEAKSAAEGKIVELAR